MMADALERDVVEDNAARIQKLLIRAKARDHEAFMDLVEILRPRLWARAWGYTADRNTAEDLLQETYLRAYRNLPDLRKNQSLTSWMLTIMDRFAIRQKYNRGHADVPLVEDAPMAAKVGAAEAFADAEHWVAYKAELQEAVARLSAKDREIISLRFGAGLNAQEIADQIQGSPGSARTRLFRALARLRKWMGVRP